MHVNILIADDQKQYRDFLRRMLESNPAVSVVAEAANGEQAVQLTQLLKPDLMLLDMDMPQVDGLNIAREVRSRRLPIRIILMSLLGDAAHQRAALASGADAFISKDAPVNELFSSIWKIARAATADVGSAAR
ncbi:MAG: response regulator [Terriglobia bacterium]